MPRAFNEYEQAHIRDRLRKAGRQLFASNGVAKASIDQLVAAAGIAKGSFYKFYDSKELLFMDLLEESQNRIRAPLLTSRASSRKAFEQLLRKLFSEFCADPLIMLMGRELEFHTVVRRLPPDYLHKHQQDDQSFLEALISKWNKKRRLPARDVMAARMTMLALLGVQREFVGERLLPYALDAAVSSLADVLFETGG